MIVNYALERYVQQAVNENKATIDRWALTDPLGFLKNHCAGNTPPNKSKDEWYHQMSDHFLDRYAEQKKRGLPEARSRQEALKDTTARLKTYLLVHTPISATYFAKKTLEEDNMERNLARHTRNGTSWQFLQAMQRLTSHQHTEEALAQRLINNYKHRRKEGEDDEQATTKAIQAVYAALLLES